MAIHIPGKRNRHNKISSTKRNMVVVLSLTAMVDMFTVLVVFLLQNLNTTGQIIEIPENVKLPQATAIKTMNPSNVLIVSTKKILLNNETVYDLDYVRNQKNWLLLELKDYVQKNIAEEAKNAKVVSVKPFNPKNSAGLQVEDRYKMTLQVDEEIDF